MVWNSPRVGRSPGEGRRFLDQLLTGGSVAVLASTAARPVGMVVDALAATAGLLGLALAARGVPGSERRIGDPTHEGTVHMGWAFGGRGLGQSASMVHPPQIRGYW
jgi:hypothetical protein